MFGRVSSESQQTRAAQSERAEPSVAAKVADTRARVCSILREYPKPAGEKLAFEVGRIGGLCQPFVRGSRASLDRCGQAGSDPYTLTSARTARSDASWPSRKQMYSKGKINLLSDPEYQSELPGLYRRIEAIRESASQLCCGDHLQCRQAMNRVEVSICQPKDDPDASDPCVFGGTFEMAGQNYSKIFGGLSRLYRSNDTMELGEIASRNLASVDAQRLRSEMQPEEFAPVGGRIVLTSYVSKDEGVRGLEPTLHHEFGHACSMVRMQTTAAEGAAPERRPKALRALRWLDQVKRRCDLGAELPEAYFDFWEGMGESRELASCLFRLTDLNRKGQIDRPCDGLCPGHYLEEAVGVAFSMLNGEMGDGSEFGLTATSSESSSESVYPNTCDHMRDRQHPMVSDVVECLAQHSPRFRARVASAYRCAPSSPASALASGS